MINKLLTFTAYDNKYSPLLTGKVTQEKKNYVTMLDTKGSRTLIGVDVFLTLCDVKTELEDGSTVATHLSSNTNVRKLSEGIWVVSFHEPLDVP
jgi:hypothetical protein